MQSEEANLTLPDVAPLEMRGWVSPDDVQRVLEGLKPGYYRAQDLYPRYLAVAAARGGPPSTVKGLGEALRRFMGPAKQMQRRFHGNVTAWEVTEEMTRGSRSE